MQNHQARSSVASKGAVLTSRFREATELVRTGNRFRIIYADPACALFGSSTYPIDLRSRLQAGIISNIMGKNIRALTNG
eukprot:1707114-Pyramimonas_sp.AAC.1